MYHLTNYIGVIVESPPIVRGGYVLKGPGSISRAEDIYRQLLEKEIMSKWTYAGQPPVGQPEVEVNRILPENLSFIQKRIMHMIASEKHKAQLKAIREAGLVSTGIPVVQINNNVVPKALYRQSQLKVKKNKRNVLLHQPKQRSVHVRYSPLYNKSK